MNSDIVSPQVHQATVTENAHLVRDYYLVRFSLINPQGLSFQAGQYVTFHIGPPKQRHIMSIASSPSQKNSIEILQCVAPNGPGSHWAMALKPGDPAEFTGPLGRFIVNKDSPRKKIFVATGCGIAPFRSMIIDYLSLGGKDEVILYWGMRHEEDVFWQEDFERLTRQYPNFHFILTLSQPRENWQGNRGHVGDHIFASENDLKDSDVYLCGSKEMIRDMMERLLSFGVPKEQIKTELFY